MTEAYRERLRAMLSRFMNNDEFERWLTEPNNHLRGCSPTDVAHSGDTYAVERVAQALTRSPLVQRSLVGVF